MKSFFALFVSVLYLSVAQGRIGSSTTAEFERRVLARNDKGTTCASNPVCAALGLEGECCPSKDGVMLDCCNRSCQAHPKCKNLADPCCPTLDGVNLDCCDHKPQLAACSAHSACAKLDLVDNCCPTADGVFLECCNSTTTPAPAP